MQTPHSPAERLLVELQELRSAQVQRTEAHQRMAEMAANPRLTDTFIQLREETQLQKERLDDLLRRHGTDPQAHTDQTVEAMIK